MSKLRIIDMTSENGKAGYWRILQRVAGYGNRKDSVGTSIQYLTRGS
jgi:hypothetical protein